MKRIILPGPETECMHQSPWELTACLKVNSYYEMYEMHLLERLHWKMWAFFQMSSNLLASLPSERNDK